MTSIWSRHALCDLGFVVWWVSGCVKQAAVGLQGGCTTVLGTLYACCVHAQDSLISSLLPGKATALCYEVAGAGVRVFCTSFSSFPAHHVLFTGLCARLCLSGKGRGALLSWQLPPLKTGCSVTSCLKQAAFFCTEVCFCLGQDVCCSTIKLRCCKIAAHACYPKACAHVFADCV